MGVKTGIAWTERTLNFWKGCKKVSSGCKNCYMFREMNRWGLDPQQITRCKTWGHARKWNREAEAAKKPILVFTCSWSDFFIREADGWREEAWTVIKSSPWLQFQILTKRIERVRNHLPADWGEGYPNVWLGVSIEDSTTIIRADVLREIPARIRFISAEPLLGSLRGLNLSNIHWLIAGGESGEEFREMDESWAVELRDMCLESGVAFFYKQGASLLPGQNTKLQGREYIAFPSFTFPIGVANAS